MIFISDLLVSQLIVLILLMVVVLRPLFKKKKYADSFAMLAVIAFCLSMLLLFVFAANILLLLITVLSLVVLLTNVRALQRFASRLYVDRYSLPFRIASYIEGICIVLCIVLCVVFQPEPLSKNVRDTQLYTGSFARSFAEKTELFQSMNLVLTEYSMENAGASSAIADAENSEVEQPLVIFLNDIGTSVQDSELRLTLAAQKGVDIITGDFYTNDGPESGTALDSAFFSNPVTKPLALHFLPPLDETAAAAFLQQKERELDELLIIAGQRATSVIIVAEGIAKQAALNAQRKYPGFVVSVFDVTENASLEPYYGRGIADLAFTNPLDALYSSFGGFSGYNEYKEFREFAQNEKHALKFAELLSQHVQSVGSADKIEIR